MSAFRLHEALKIWRPVIGLEIHAQLATKSKIFSGAGTSFNQSTNNQVAFLDMALPGTLPVLNRRCVELAVKVALALDCKINLISEFDRKHYFYADLPAGYQITQQRRAVANHGSLKYLWRSGNTVNEDIANILQVQLEQDSGKSLHDERRDLSFIDLNRAGVGLVEIVTAPDFSNGLTASAFIYELRTLLMSLGACSGDMSQGALRVDANISVHRPDEPLGVRSEVKNLNSLSKIRRAIDWEIERQIQLLELGESIVNETMTFDDDLGITVPMRDKEKLQDYRYYPEPNLPPLRLFSGCSLPDDSPCRRHEDNQIVCVECLRRSLPPLLPSVRRHWLNQTLGLPLAQVDSLILEPGLLDFFLSGLASAGYHVTSISTEPPPGMAELGCELSYWLTGFCLGQLRKADLSSVDDAPWTPENLTEVAAMRLNGDLNQVLAKQLIVELMARESDTGVSARALAEANEWTVIHDEALIRRCCQEVLAEESRAVKGIKKGKKSARNTLIRKAATKMNGRLSSELVQSEMDRLIEELQKSEGS